MNRLASAYNLLYSSILFGRFYFREKNVQSLGWVTSFKRIQCLVLALLIRIYNFNRYSPFEITHRRRWYQQITQTNAKNASASRKKPMTYTKPKKNQGIIFIIPSGIPYWTRYRSDSKFGNDVGMMWLNWIFE